MTGAYLRVQRNGKWENVEVEYLTDQEREQLLQDDPRLIRWLHLTCRVIATCEKAIKDNLHDEMTPLELSTLLRIEG